MYRQPDPSTSANSTPPTSLRFLQQQPARKKWVCEQNSHLGSNPSNTSEASMTFCGCSQLLSAAQPFSSLAMMQVPSRKGGVAVWVLGGALLGTCPGTSWEFGPLLQPTLAWWFAHLSECETRYLHNSQVLQSRP